MATKSPARQTDQQSPRHASQDSGMTVKPPAVPDIGCLDRKVEGPQLDDMTHYRWYPLAAAPSENGGMQTDPQIDESKKAHPAVPAPHARTKGMKRTLEIVDAVLEILAFAAFLLNLEALVYPFAAAALLLKLLLFAAMFPEHVE